MGFFEDRRQRKRAREVLHGARKWTRVNRDLLTPARIQEIGLKLDALAAALRSRQTREAVARAEAVEESISVALPARSHPSLRENVEVFLVAAIVAMAVRTFFIQPFKIPTGSMQPTLYGIHTESDCVPNPNPLRRLVDLAVFGATHSGSRCTVRGDHIFVDKVSYHFRKPQRGEVVVFETTNIPEMGPDARGKFYIKRLIGLADETLRIVPPHVLVDGKIVNSRPAFERIYSMKNHYNGYVNQPPRAPRPPYLGSPDSEYRVPPKHFFVLGDNSVSSSDGRYWGSVPEENLVGRAILVYWPFSRRFGSVQ